MSIIQKIRDNGGLIQTISMTIKDAMETGLFSFFTNPTSKLWVVNFLKYAFFPLIGLSLLANLVVELVNYKHLKNKNLLAKVGIGVGILATTAALISIITSLAVASFVAAPWFFIGALGLNFVHQGFLLVKNLVQGFSARQPSIRKAHFQEAFANSKEMLLLAATITSVLVVMLIPQLGLTVMAVAGATAAVFTLGKLIWRFMPEGKKQWIKSKFGFGKTAYESEKSANDIELEELNDLAQKDEAKFTKDNGASAESKAQISTSNASFNLFKQPNRKLAIVRLLRASGAETAKSYLLDAIKAKITHINAQKGDALTSIEDKKRVQKVSVLTNLQQHLENTEGPVAQLFEEEDIKAENPGAYQSAWRNTSDTMDLYHAVKFFDANKETISVDASVAETVTVSVPRAA